MKHSQIIKTIAKQNGKEPKNKELAQILGLSADGIRSRAFRDKEYSYDEVQKIANFYKVDFSNEPNALDIANTLSDRIKQINNEVVQVVFRPNVYLSAGYGVEVCDEHAEYMTLDKRLFFTDRGTKINPKNCEIVSVSGNSMAPEYRHGDRVIIDKSITEFIDGHIFAFRYGGECYIKEINLLGKRVKAVPLNKEYDAFYIEPNEDVKIFGRIIPRVRL